MTDERRLAKSPSAASCAAAWRAAPRPRDRRAAQARSNAGQCSCAAPSFRGDQYWETRSARRRKLPVPVRRQPVLLRHDPFSSWSRDVVGRGPRLERARRDRESQLADARALRERPELRSAFITLHVAEKFAERHIRDPCDRALFVERVKAVMALSAKSSAQMPEPRRRAPPEPAPRRDDPTR